MRSLNHALGVGIRVLGACTKTAAAVTHFMISKVIGAGGSVTIQSLLLASNACFLYAGMFITPFQQSHASTWRGPRRVVDVRVEY